MTIIRKLLVALIVGMLLTPASAQVVPGPGHVTGVGGVFFRSKDPKTLMAWYRDVLGLKLESWGGAKLAFDAPGHPPVTTVMAFDANSDELAGSTREFMLNLSVDDMAAMLARLKAKGVPVLKQENDKFGKFVWIMDPDGTKIELWEPVGK